jgi:hypothetical protein
LENDEVNQLVLKDFGGIPEITQEAWQLKREALEVAGKIAWVKTPQQQTAAVAALQKLKVVRSGIEDSRKAVKAPVLELGRKIDEIARNYAEEIEKQYGRLSGMINHYQRKLLAAQQEEIDKAKAQGSQVVELREKAAEYRALMLQAVDMRSATEWKSKAEKLETEAFDLEMQLETAPVTVANDKPKGLVVKNRVNFQVIDAIVFAQAWPQFWKWHEDTETLKLDRMRILDELNRADQRGVFHMTRFPEELSQVEDRRLVQPAGLRIYEETKSHVR